MSKGRLQRNLALIVPLIAFLFFLTPSLYAYGKEETPQWLTMDFFYMKSCETCKDEEEFIEHVKTLLQEERRDVDIQLRLHNTFYARGSERLKEFLEDYPIQEEIDASERLLFIGGTWILDNKDFNQQLREVFVREKEKIFSGTGRIQIDIQGANLEDAIEETKVSNHGLIRIRENGDSLVVYAYTSPCSACEEINRLLQDIGEGIALEGENKRTVSQLWIQKYNVGSIEDLEMVRRYFEAYGVPEKEQQVPIVFIGESYLSGEKQIKNELLDRLGKGYGRNTLDLSEEETRSSSILGVFSGYEVLGVFITGLINGLNPCSLSMLLFFMAAVALKNISILKLGFAYISGKFITYLALGILFYDVLNKLDSPWFAFLQGFLKNGLFIIVCILVVVNLRDYFAAKNEKYEKIKLQLPTFLRRYNHNWIKKISSANQPKKLLLFSFGLGIIISIGEFLCTGQIYLATILYVLKTSEVLDIRALAFFILYGGALITPLSLLTIGIHKGREVFELSDYLREKMHIIKLINALFFALFGLIVYFLF